MKSRKMLRIALDIALGLVLVAIMATALVQEEPHEWLGLTLFVLIVCHAIVNRRWIASIFRGRYNAVRILQVVVLAGLIACIIGQVASSLVLSKYAFGFLPALPGASWARRAHMICSYWSFILACAHAGLHIRVPRRATAWLLWVCRAAIAAAACYGAISFVQLGLPSYLVGSVQFASADFEAPLWLPFARYTSIGVLVAALFHYASTAIAAATKKLHGR